MKTIIAGGRDIIDQEFVEDVIGQCPWDITEVVSGGARGVDTCGEEWANNNDVPVTLFPVTPDEWKKFGASAGPRRNRKMAQYAEALILVWDGKSAGSGNMLEEAFAENLRLFVRKYPK